MQPYQKIIENTLSPLIKNSAPIALFDFPNYSNVGDSAIWLGERKFLNFFANLKILTADSIYSAQRTLPDIPNDTIILINGGGNFGDIYPRHQELRLRLLRHYQHNRIIQLPQSIHFQNKKNFEISSTAMRNHRDFHLLVRDHESLQIAKKLHEGNSLLCPDMALYLSNFTVTIPASYPVFGLLRSDTEKLHIPNKDFLANVVTSDWINEPKSIRKALALGTDFLQFKTSLKSRPVYKLKIKIYDNIANSRMKRGCNILSSGQVIITDRLHGHILCTLMNIPHVILDNKNNKIKKFFYTWKTGEKICKMAKNFDDAMSMANDLLRTIKSS